MPYTTTDISWKKYEQDVHSPDTETQRQATDKFLAEREHVVPEFRLLRRLGGLLPEFLEELLRRLPFRQPLDP